MLTGCGAGSGPVGVSTSAADSRPVQLSLRDTEGTSLEVATMQGRPVLLFLFASFDGVCQAAVRPLSRAVRRHPEVDVVAIAVQPDAAILAGAWQQALTPPFIVTYELDDQIAEGTSDLGRVDTVPTYVLLDASGHEIDRHVGFASERKLEELLSEAGATGGQ